MAPPGRGCAVRGCHPGQTNIQHDIFTIGAGMVDIAAAMAATDTSTRSAISPTATFDTASNSVRLSTGANVVWGENSAYALNVVWGSGCRATNVVPGLDTVTECDL